MLDSMHPALCIPTCCKRIAASTCPGTANYYKHSISGFLPIGFEGDAYRLRLALEFVDGSCQIL